MDTLNRDFTSFNCSSGTLRLETKPNNLNNVVSKNCNVKDGNNDNDNSPEIWKRRSNLQSGDDPEAVGLTIANSFETFYSDDGTEKSGCYDLVANSNNDSLLSLSSIDLDPNQPLDKQGCYSFVNSQDSVGSSCKDSLGNSTHSEGVDLSAPRTPVHIPPRPSPLGRKKQTTLPPSREKPKSEKVNQKHSSDPLGLRDDFGKLISPCLSLQVNYAPKYWVSGLCFARLFSSWRSHSGMPISVHEQIHRYLVNYLHKLFIFTRLHMPVQLLLYFS